MLLASFLAGITAQSTFLTVKKNGESSLNANQKGELQKAIHSKFYKSVEVIDIGDISEYLEGKTLRIQISGKTHQFEVDYVTSTSADYIWVGYGKKGERFSLSKDKNGYTGVMENIEGENYSIQPLGGNQALLCNSSVNIERNTCRTQESKKDQLIVEKEEEKESYRGGGNRNIRVLFLFTINANITGNPTAVATQVINEINAASVASGLSTLDICFTNAGVIQLNGFTEGNDMGDDLDDLIDDNTANTLRDNNFADVVVLLTSGPLYETAGIANGIGVSNANAFVISDMVAAEFGFTATHEIGHAIGTRHQRCSTCSMLGCDIVNYYHGFPIGTTGGTNGRTIMYQNACSGRERMGRWSDPTALLNGESTGNVYNKNTAILKSRAKTVAAFRPSPPNPPSTVAISGPTMIGCDPSYTWSASFNSGDFPGSKSYTWEQSPNGVSGWQNVGNQSSLTYSGSQIPTSFFVLRLTMEDNLGNNGQATKSVNIANCSPIDNASTRNNEGINRDIIVFPNPADKEFTLSINNASTSKRIIIYDLAGKIIESIILEEDISSYSFGDTYDSGTYLVQVGNKYEKIVKL